MSEFAEQDRAEPQWSVQDGTDGPVEMLTTFNYMRLWLREQRTANPHQSMMDLLVAWCRQHPEYVHDKDPRGLLSWARSDVVRLDDGGHITVAAEEHVQHDDWDARNVTVKILRLPHRALSLREARDLAQMILSLPVDQDGTEQKAATP